MAETTIEWADFTFNPWVGCSKESPACKNCYAERDMDTRLGRVKWGPNGTRSVTAEGNWKQPLKWNRQAECIGVFGCNAGDPADCCPQAARPRVFCASIADVFEDWNGPMLDHKKRQLFRDGDGWFAPDDDHMAMSDPVTMDDVRCRLFDLIDATPNLDWLLLTKRPENIQRMWVAPADHVSDSLWSRNWLAEHLIGSKKGRPNVWLGTTVENQKYADKRVPALLRCRGLSPVLFLSCEPLVGPVRLDSSPQAGPPRWLTGEIDHGDPTIDWVITGGESGPGARPAHPDWYRSLRDQCDAAGVPFHFKQWGEWASVSEVEGDGAHHRFPDGATVRRVGKKNAGRELDGKVHDGCPAVASV